MQAVDHPYLVEYSLTSMEKKGKAVDTRNDEKCGLCNDPEEETVVSCFNIICSVILAIPKQQKFQIKISTIQSCSSIISLFRMFHIFICVVQMSLA